jgi:hypothetical protein
MAFAEQFEFEAMRVGDRGAPSSSANSNTAHAPPRDAEGYDAASRGE